MTTQEAVKKLAGGTTKIAWAQQQKECSNFVGARPDFKLMCFDTDIGERCLTDDIQAYTTPRITHDGSRIVFTNNTDKTINVINWDGSGRQVLCDGFGLCLWTDPQTGEEWVYMRANTTKDWFSKSKPVTRFQLDDPSVKETVWTKKSISWEWFQVSPDGTKAAVCMFWPTCGMIDFPTMTFKKFDKGCWTAMAPDNSHRMWVFDPDHRTVKLYDRDGKRLCRLDLSTAPGTMGWEIYYPKWSNNVRYFTITGPWSDNHEGPCDRESEVGKANNIPKGGYNVDLYIGRFDEPLTKVEDWVRVTENDKADFFGDAWIQPEK